MGIERLGVHSVFQLHAWSHPCLQGPGAYRTV